MQAPSQVQVQVQVPRAGRGPTVAGELDAILQAGFASLTYFQRMLEIARRVAPGNWPDWQEHFVSRYHRELDIDLDALRADAGVLRAQADTARREKVVQYGCRAAVATAWPDATGTVALRQMDAHQRRAEPIAAVLAAAADALDAVPGAVQGAVTEKVRLIGEFSRSGLAATLPSLTFVAPDSLSGNMSLWRRFAEQLTADIAQFDEIVEQASDKVRDAYQRVCDASKSLDTSIFPLPSFTPPVVEAGRPRVGAVGPGGATVPGSAGNDKSGGAKPAAGSGGAAGAGGAGAQSTAGGGGGARTSAPTAAPTTTAGGGSGAVQPHSSQPFAGAMPASSDRAGFAGVAQPGGGAGRAGMSTGTRMWTGGGGQNGPAGGDPAGSGSGGFGRNGLGTGFGGMGGTGSDGGGMPSWLSSLIPKIAEQLGLGGHESGSGEHGTKTSGDKGAVATDAGEKGAGEKRDGEKGHSDRGAGDKETGDKRGGGKDPGDTADPKDPGAKGDDPKQHGKQPGTTTTTDSAGRTISATLRADGVTVDVTVTWPDGTVDKATLTVDADGASHGPCVGADAKPAAAGAGSAQQGLPDAGATGGGGAPTGGGSGQGGAESGGQQAPRQPEPAQPSGGDKPGGDKPAADKAGGHPGADHTAGGGKQSGYPGPLLGADPKPGGCAPNPPGAGNRTGAEFALTE
ncbi:hypothetical protein [Tsukamurella soli]|uniref:hypothetical protein n=1 Tax=Tsukamurella soli TaxID=644556 RepID=UPI0031EDAE18